MVKVNSMAGKLNIAINGVGGRMGAALQDAIATQTDLVLSAAFERADSKIVGQTLDCGVAVMGSDRIGGTDAAPFDVLIDFSVPQASVEALRLCAQAGRGAVVGTTGFTPEQQDEVAGFAEQTAIVQAPNMSLGVNVCFALARQAAGLLGDGELEVDIVEAHHKGKRDAPSGTALRMGDKVSEGLDKRALAARASETGTLTRDNIAYHVVRAGDLPGEHAVVMTLPGEQIEIRHKAVNRSNFALGALAAARWVNGRAPGLYGMDDVFAL